MGTPRLTWRRLAVLIAGLVQDPTTRVWAVLAGDLAPWTPQVRLLAEIVNATRETAWLQTDDAASRHPKYRPDRLLPPDVEPAASPSRRVGTAHMSLDETRDWLGW